MRSKLRSIAQITAVFLFAVANLDAVICQQRPDSGGTERERERELNERELEERMMNLRLMSIRARKSKRSEDMNLAVAQIQDDSTRIQVLNTALARAALDTPPLDLKFVIKSLAEIKKRADRLNENLVLPEPDESQKPVAPLSDPTKVKSSLLELGYLIVRFVDNPFFKEASVVDTQLTARARGDLEAIIKWTDQLKRTVEELQKTRKSR